MSKVMARKEAVLGSDPKAQTLPCHEIVQELDKKTELFNYQGWDTLKLGWNCMREVPKAMEEDSSETVGGKG